ncbi:MAG: nuclear transport factor 2 family protein [Bacteroidia bacterium]|nr:nuclear transport factor 2 family protein [Bacteroidia bacterium]
MHTDNTQLIERFYTSFQERDVEGMKSCYHPEVVFSDEAFPRLEGARAGAMWHMLLSGGDRAPELLVNFTKVAADASHGSCHWEAVYTFSLTGRKVHNKIEASFEFRDGKIYRHVDRFNFWRWSRMALGPTGWLLGWSGFLKRKVQQQAARRLDKFVSTHAEYQQ